MVIKLAIRKQQITRQLLQVVRFWDIMKKNYLFFILGSLFFILGFWVLGSLFWVWYLVLSHIVLYSAAFDNNLRVYGHI